MIAAMRARVATRVVGACWLVLALTLFSSTVAAQVGYVYAAVGLVSVNVAGVAAKAAAVGDQFREHTVFRTGPNGKLTLKFADGQVIILDKDSALRVGRYRYVPGHQQRNDSALELTKGRMRYIAGAIGTSDPEGVRIFAGKSSIAVLIPGGVDFAVAVDPYPQEVGHAVVARGEISVTTPYGRIEEITSSQYVPWSPGRGVLRPVPWTAAPAVVQALLTAFWSIIPPDDKPVQVASAASAAAAGAAADTKPADKTGSALAGYVVEVTPATVSLRSASGASERVTVGKTFEAGARFDTGATGRVALRLADGQLVILGPNSVLSVGDYRFDPGNPGTGKLALELANGAMRFVAGEIERQNFAGVSISVGASIIDILNAGQADDFTVVVDTRDQEVGIARVTRGEISVRTPYGPIDRIAADESRSWGPGKTPAPVVPLATSMALIQEAVALQLSGLPKNTPVDVATAATAAAAVAEANSAQQAANADPQNVQLQTEAKAAVELAMIANEASAKADEALAAQNLAAALETLPAAGAGVATPPTELAQAPVEPPAPPPPAAAVTTPVTPGGGGRCTGSVC